MLVVIENLLKDGTENLKQFLLIRKEKQMFPKKKERETSSLEKFLDAKEKTDSTPEVRPSKRIQTAYAYTMEEINEIVKNTKSICCNIFEEMILDIPESSLPSEDRRELLRRNLNLRRAKIVEEDGMISFNVEKTEKQKEADVSGSV
jgi:hypothetical protein